MLLVLLTSASAVVGECSKEGGMVAMVPAEIKLCTSRLLNLDVVHLYPVVPAHVVLAVCYFVDRIVYRGTSLVCIAQYS